MKRKIYKFITDLDQEQTKKMLLILLAIFIFVLSIIFRVVCEESKRVKQYQDPNLVSPEMGRKMSDMTKGYPIENMLPFIVQKDKTVAAYLVSIAKKESNWGKRVPVKNGKDCYNYWGFRLATSYMGSSGHTCFKNPEQAVNVVSDRIKELVKNEKKNSPGKMVVWKCGYDCAGQNGYDVKKWISDVGFYYKKLIN